MTNAPIIPIDPDHLTLATKEAKAIGAKYAERYQSAEPYHHICLDNFLPMEVIEKVRADLASLPDAEASFDAAEEKLKSQYNPDGCRITRATSFRRSTPGPSSCSSRK